MPKPEPLRMRLARKYTIPEIELMIKDVENDPDNMIGATPPFMYNKKAIKKMDEMSWAIYTIRKKLDKR